MAKSESLSEKEILAGLESTNTSRVYSSLINLRQNYVNNIPKMRKLALKHGVLKLVITHLEHPKLCNVALSIISNSCMDHCLREEVLKCNGIIPLARILSGLANGEIMNRACRAVGNIALSENGLVAVHEAKPVGDIVSFLTSTDVEDYQLTAVRTLRILSQEKKKLRILVRENAIYAIAKLLLLDKPNVVACSVKALALMTHNCNADVAQQIRRAEVLPSLVQLYSENKDSNVQENCLTCLQNLSRVSAMREELGEAGAFQIFINVASSEQYSPKAQLAALALCFCCGEYWDRRQIRQLNGLHTLVNILKSEHYECIHRHVITALTHLCTEIDDPNVFSKLNLFQVLLERLKNFVEKNKVDHHVSISSFTFGEVTQTLENDDVEKWENEGCEKDEEQIIDLLCFDKSEKDKKIKCETPSTSPKSSRICSNNDAVFSIHSPTYQGVQYSELNSVHVNHNSYASFSSPLGSVTQSGSPECYSFDWNPNSPVSCCSMLSPWSASSSSNDVQNMCWSPVLSSRSHTPDSCNEEVDVDSTNIPSESLQVLSLENSEKTSTVSKTESSLKLSTDVSHATGSCVLEQSFSSRLMKTSSKDDSECSTPTDSFVKPLICQEAVFDNGCSAEQKSLNEGASAITANRKSCNSITPLVSSAIEACDTETAVEPVDTEMIFADISSSLPSCVKESYDVLNKSKGIKRKLPPTSQQYGSLIKKSAIPDSIQAISGLSHKLSGTEKEENSVHSGKRLDHYILLLLSHLTRQLLNTSYWNSVEELNITVFIHYLSLIPSPNMRAIKILKNLVSNYYSFQKLICSDFVGQVERLMDPSHDTNACDHCLGVQSAKNELMEAAKVMSESSFGITTLRNILQGNNQSHQLYCLYAISRLYKSKLELYRVLVKINALPNLIELLQSEDDHFFKTAATTLSYMWHILNESFIKEEPHESTCDIYCKYMYMSRNGHFNVELTAKDNLSIFALRTQLCERSDYFRGLLDGQFIEAKQNVVAIPTVTRRILLYIMHFLHGCQSGWCPFLGDISTSDLPDLLKAADLFLLDDVKTHTQNLMVSQFEMKTAVDMYNASKLFGTQQHSDTLLSLILCHGFRNEKEFIPCLQRLFIAHQDDFVRYVTTFVREYFK